MVTRRRMVSLVTGQIEITLWRPSEPSKERDKLVFQGPIREVFASLMTALQEPHEGFMTVDATFHGLDGDVTFIFKESENVEIPLTVFFKYDPPWEG